MNEPVPAAPVHAAPPPDSATNPAHTASKQPEHTARVQHSPHMRVPAHCHSVAALPVPHPSPLPGCVPRSAKMRCALISPHTINTCAEPCSADKHGVIDDAPALSTVDPAVGVQQQPADPPPGQSSRVLATCSSLASDPDRLPTPCAATPLPHLMVSVICATALLTRGSARSRLDIVRSAPSCPSALAQDKAFFEHAHTGHHCDCDECGGKAQAPAQAWGGYTWHRWRRG